MGKRQHRRPLLAILALLTWAGSAQATTIDDPLHGRCSGCTSVTIGGNDVTLLGPGGVTGFGFDASPEASGTLQLKFLIPNNFTLAQVQVFEGLVSVTGTSSSSLDLYSTTPWTSGFLETDYLHNTLAPGAPKNPLDAWLGATQTVQPTATGYYVLTAEMGPYDLVEPGQGPSDNLFSLSPAIFAQGGFIVGNLFTANGVVSTAQSGALFFNGPSGGPFCTVPPCDVPPVPGPIAGAGLPGLVSACFALWGLARHRRKRREG